MMDSSPPHDNLEDRTPEEILNDPEYIKYGYDVKTFRNTFQKPTNIYKYLKQRWKKNPFCLNRNLSYINKHRRQILVPRCKKIDLLALKLDKEKRENHSAHNNKILRGIRNDNLNLKNSVPTLCMGVAPVLYKPDDDKFAYYNWICSASTKQLTKSFGYICPWCIKDFYFLDSLMMHLRCYHPRLQFGIMDRNNETIINVTLNLSYDNTYVGFKYPGHDLKKDFEFKSDRPQKRVRDPSWTDYYFFRAKKRPFIENPNVTTDNNNADNNNIDDDYEYYENSAVNGNSGGRLYYHTTTCLPIKPKEIDMDSEADTDPLWLRQRTQLMIDEFTDVNEGEKEIMKMWNLHLMENYQYTADHMMAKACLEFVDKEGKQIILKNLFKNFVLHLINLYNFGLLSSMDVLDCIRKLRNPIQQKQQENQLSNSNNLNRYRNVRPLSNGYSTHT